MQGNALEISLDFQFGPIPAIFSAHAPGITFDYIVFIYTFFLASPTDTFVIW